MSKERTRKIALYLSYIAQVMFEEAGEKWKPIFSELDPNLDDNDVD